MLYQFAVYEKENPSTPLGLKDW